MKLSKLSNQTNSQDPQAVNSRIFVGNLNTFQCSKTDVERMFQIYGRLAGISMHKGYAFVQFTNPFDARNACLGEDGKMVLSQTLDVNMVAEPKPHQVGRKRQNVNKTGNDWDYFYDSYCSSTLSRSNSMRPKKRKRLMSNSSRMVALNDAVANNNINAAVAAAAVAQQHQHLAQQQQQQHQHQQHQHQQVAAVAMAAMANLLPQQQLLLHQQNLMSNSNGATTITAAASCNGSTTTPHHSSLNVFLQQQQQQHHHIKQQQQAAAAAVAAAQYAAVTNGGLQLKLSPPMITASTTQQQQQQSIATSAASLLTHNGEQHMTTTTSPTTNQLLHAQQQHHQHQQQQNNLQLMQPLSLTLSPQQNHLHQQHQQQQQQQHSQIQQHHLHHQHLKQPLYQCQQPQLQLTSHQIEPVPVNHQWGPFKVYSNADTLICGNCRECFNELTELLDHKRSYCKLRFTCKCQETTLPAKNPFNGAKLLCAVCKDAFNNPWDLMVHAQAAHMVNIYELGNEPNNNNSINGINSINNNNNNNNNNISTSNGSIISENHLTVEELDNNNMSASNNNDKELNNNNLHCNNDNNDTNNNHNKNHNNGLPLSLPTVTTTVNTTTCFPMPDVKMQAPTQTSSLVNVNTTDAAIINATNGNNCNRNTNNSNSILSSSSLSSSSLLGNGSSSSSTCETDAHLSMELKFGICNSPIGSITNKENGHRDDGSLDGRMSDDIKMMHTNGSVSSRGSTPDMDNDAMPQTGRACTMRTLSIEATTTNTPTTAATLGLIPNSLTLSLKNATSAKATAALAPQ